jgi:Phospholipase_D-nuclease N-terminal
VLAYDYPLLDLFWTVLWFALFVIWVWLLIVIFSDLFGSHDVGGLGKALWVLVLIFLPFFGILFYLLFRGPGMRARRDRDAAAP